MKDDKNSRVPAPGWVGGFAESNPDFAYPDPDLSSLLMLDNMANIDKLQRQQAVLWPEFSWETVPGNAESRCFQMFAPDISRLGYTDEGRVYSIICPQQGVCFDEQVCLNVEVTVTGQRGWANETAERQKELAADLSVEGTIWFSPGSCQNWLVKEAWDLFKDKDLPFPSNKANAIKVTTHKVGEPEQPIFALRGGESTGFDIPSFAKHSDEAWAVGNLGVQIGAIRKTGHDAVDSFNQQVLDLFNKSSGNMLKLGNVLTWNIWFDAPELVDQQEWRGHAEKWRKSIDADHGSPDGPGTNPRFFDGSPFKAEVGTFEEMEAILKLLKEVVFG